MLKLTSFLLLAVHIFSCGWHFVGLYTEGGWIEKEGYTNETVVVRPERLEIGSLWLLSGGFRPFWVVFSRFMAVSGRFGPVLQVRGGGKMDLRPAQRAHGPPGADFEVESKLWKSMSSSSCHFGSYMMLYRYMKLLI